MKRRSIQMLHGMGVCTKKQDKIIMFLFVSAATLFSSLNCDWDQSLSWDKHITTGKHISELETAQWKSSP